MVRSAFTASVILVSFAALSFAQSKPNFSGTWKLNISKSEFGVLPGPESQTDVIEHTDPVVKIATTRESAQGKIQSNLTYTTDSKEGVNKIGPREIKSTTAWEGNAMVVNSKLTFNEQEVTIKATWTLSEDGNTLTQNVHLASGMGETDQKLVFEKQSGDAVTKVEPEKAIVKPSTASGPKPNFSGVWKLNAAKSDFSVLPGPDSRTDTIEHNEPELKLSRKEVGAQGAREYAINMTNNGQEVVNKLGGSEAKVTSTWEGNSLVVVMKLKFQDQDVTIKQVCTLSDDGKTLMSNNHIASAMGELDQKEVYDKQ